MSANDLSRLLFPQSIVFIGGHECAIAIRRCREFGFTGQIHAVHPARQDVGGVPAVTSLDKIDRPMDAAFLALKREPTIDVVRQLRAQGCGGAVIYAAGFAETGDSQLQNTLLAAADGMPLLGPNCYGFVNGLGRVALWPDEHGIKPLAKGIAIVTQSGNIACNMTFTRRALPLAAVFTIGNQADVDMARMIDFLSADDRITAIGLHIEGVKTITAFAAACALARQRGKPIVVLKTGKSAQGARTTQSHTASLSGADQLFDALFKRYGVARVPSITSFVETLKFLHHGGPLSDARLVSLSCSGGEAALAADLALQHKVSFPPFSKDTKARVAATLNDYVSVENPLDYHTFIWNDEDKLLNTFTSVLGGGFDVAMLILDTPTQTHVNPEAWHKTARAFKTASVRQGARAAVVATLPECLPETMADHLSQAGIAPLHGLDDALTAFESAAFIGRNWAAKARLPALVNPGMRQGTPVLLSEHQAKQLLKGFGLPVPKSVVCKAADAAKTASRIGFPVALKIACETVAHKTEMGGVILHLTSTKDVRAAAARLSKFGPDVLVEQMITGSICELIIGITRDPQFGLALLIGAGGVLTELLQDSATLLLPTTPSEIKSACESLKVWKLVTGYRGSKGDTKAVFAAIKAVAAFAAAHADRLEELDINPLLVLPNGVVAVDAFLRMRTS